MTPKRSGGGPDAGDNGTWATESLPLSVRKELLERELAKLGFRKAGAQGTPARHEGTASQTHGDAGASHPQAESPPGGSHAE